jgi:glutamate:GABA antiporter
MPLIAILISIGLFSVFNIWILAPCRGLLVITQAKYLPTYFNHANTHNIPSRLLIMQGMLITLLASLYLWMPNLASFYWLLFALSALLALLLNILLFAAAIRLRYSKSDVSRPYKIPGGKPVIWICGGIGILCCLAAFVVGFIPPIEFKTFNVVIYETILIGGVLLFIVMPFILKKCFGREK